MTYKSFISVSSAAADRSLLTIEQLRDAAGVTGTGSDTKLEEIGRQVAAAISKACRIVTDGVNPPTLRLETIVETFRRESCWANGAWPYADSRKAQNELILSRFPAPSITSVVADGVTLAASEYELRKAEGALVRLSNDSETAWTNWKIVVTYTAGYATVPDDLALAAKQFVQILWHEDGRDPNLKSDAVDGIGRKEWFQANAQRDIIPPSILGMLSDGGYVNTFHG